jgi:hypothetical protein
MKPECVLGKYVNLLAVLLIHKIKELQYLSKVTSFHPFSSLQKERVRVRGERKYFWTSIFMLIYRMR